MPQSANTVQFSVPKPQNEAEKKFANCMQKGQSCQINDGIRPKKPEYEGGKANVIRAELIRAFALGRDIPLNHIQLGGAWVVGELDLSFADIRGVLGFFCCHFEKEVLLAHTDCHALYMNGSRLSEGLWGDSIRVKRALSLRYKFAAQRGVLLAGAKIGGDLDCIGSVFVNPGENAFFADGAKIGGCLRLRDSKFKGQVRMNGVSIGTHLECQGITLSDGMEIAAAEIKKSLVFLDIKGSGTCNFGAAKMDSIQDDEKSRKNFNFFLGGCSYKRFQFSGDVKSRIEWLKSRLKRKGKGIEFSPQPFEHAAKILFAMGHDSDAREILLEKEQLLTEHGKISIWHKVVRWLWNVFAGYGYRLRWTLAWSALIISVGAAVFHCADEAHYIVPHQPIVLNLTQDQKVLKDRKCTDIKRPTEVVECLLPEHPKFRSLVYSLDVFIPFFAMHQEPFWYPQHIGLELWYWFEIFMGWVLTSLFVLSGTGLLRPRQSSGVE